MNTEITAEDRGRNVSRLLQNHAWGVYDQYAKLGRDGITMLVNTLAFVLQDEEPILITGAVADPETHTVEVAVFTSEMVIYYKGESKMEPPAFQIIPRNDLTEMRVLSAPFVVPTFQFQAANMARYELQYGSAARFNLPINPWAEDGARGVIDELLPALFANLKA